MPRTITSFVGAGRPAGDSLATVLDERVRPATLVVPEPDGAVRCFACGHRCLVKPGRRGICKVRFNRDGTLLAPWGYVAALQCDPTEKKPFFHVLPGSDTLTFESQARDLSRGGMFIRTELLDPVGTPCMLTVLPDGGAAVVMQGVVAHVVESRVDRQGRSPGLGVKFASLSPDAERWLGHTLAERARRV